MTNVRLKLAPPWVTYVNEINALFGDDPDIGITYDNDACEVKLHVEKPEKAAAISWMLPPTKTFGNVTLKVTVIPANKLSTGLDFEHMTFEQIFDMMFDKNPAYVFSRTIDGILSNKLTYVVFAAKVVQMFSDNLNDLYGNITTLYQEVAHDVFNGDDIGGVFFCTEPITKLNQPLGEWP